MALHLEIIVNFGDVIDRSEALEWHAIGGDGDQYGVRDPKLPFDFDVWITRGESLERRLRVVRVRLHRLDLVFAGRYLHRGVGSVFEVHEDGRFAVAVLECGVHFDVLATRIQFGFVVVQFQRVAAGDAG